MPKDWIGNSKAVWATLGASNHTENEREKMIIMQQMAELPSYFLK